MNYNYTLKDTNISKGIAIVLLLIHHLFYTYNPDLYSDIEIFSSKGHVYSLFNILAHISKVTVWIFVILSGYGLYKSFRGGKKFLFKKI